MIHLIKIAGDKPAVSVNIHRSLLMARWNIWVIHDKRAR